MNDRPPNDTMQSRTRPGRQVPVDPDVAALPALRRATRDYLVVLEAGLKALTDPAIEDKPIWRTSEACWPWPVAGAAAAASALQSASRGCSAGRWGDRGGDDMTDDTDVDPTSDQERPAQLQGRVQAMVQ